MYLFDKASLEHALSVPTDTHLRRLLAEHLENQPPAIDDAPYFLIVDRDSTIDELTDELGWSPLTDLDGRTYSDDTFAPIHDYLEGRDGWFVMIVSGSNDAAFVLFIQDDDGVPADLLAFCHEHAGAAR